VGASFSAPVDDGVGNPARVGGEQGLRLVKAASALQLRLPFAVRKRRKRGPSRLDIGAVVFFDSGYVWPASSRVQPNDMKSSVGLGLRVAPSRSGGNSPVRIDLAYALSDNKSSSRFSLSILAGQAFGP